MPDNLPPQWHRRIQDAVVPSPDATYVTRHADPGLSDEQSLDALDTGLVKVTIGTGVLSTAVEGVDYSLVRRQYVALPLANLQAAGAVLTATFNVGAALPANARVLAAELVVVEAFAGLGLVSALGTVQASTDAAGSLVNGAVLTALGTAGLGLNPYASRGGQQVTVKVTNVGLNLSGLTAGSITVNILYAVIA